MSLPGPVFERIAAAVLLAVGGGCLGWLHGEVAALQAATGRRLQQARAIAALRVDAGRVGVDLPRDDPFPAHELGWQPTVAGPWLVLRPAAAAEPAR